MIIKEKSGKSDFFLQHQPITTMPVPDSNPVGTLQEHAQSKGGTFPLYQLLQAVGESHCPNQEKTMDKNNIEIEDTYLKHTAVQKLFPGNKIGELQENCMGRGLSIPTYTDRETSGPSHMRHFKIMCALGSAETVVASYKVAF